MFRVGDLVFPADLPQPFPCRVAAVESCAVAGRAADIVYLDVLDGPWPAGTRLVRLAGAVRAWPRPTERSADAAGLRVLAGGLRAVVPEAASYAAGRRARGQGPDAPCPVPRRRRPAAALAGRLPAGRRPGRGVPASS